MEAVEIDNNIIYLDDSFVMAENQELGFVFVWKDQRVTEESEGQSLQLIRPCELYPKTVPVMEEEGLVVPFNPLCGEFVAYVGRTATGVMALSNYRIYHQVTKVNNNTFYNIPLGLVEQVEVKDILYLQISCKDATICRLSFTTNEICTEWVRRITKATSPVKNVEDVFAFSLYAWAHEEGNEEILCRLNDPNPVDVFNSEVERLQFDVSEGGPWRISTANKEYELCKSYPRLLLVPSDITDDKLDAASKFRSSRRVPAIVWRHKGNGAVIARCSQPEVGLLGWRSSFDEELSNSILMACSPNPDNGKKLLIMDARSYTTAWVNRARGGGCEYPEYYPKCEIQFMNLANIHAIRKSFCALRNICWTSVDQPNWFSLLEGTRWLQNMSGLIHAAITLANAVENDGRPVLVHCSDGWDRTPQIVALAQLLLDPYYRTIEGFRVLVEREWLEFGHKFADRCGLRDDINERCPVFLQWLDCIHNIVKQYPCAFELNSNYLIKLAQHTYSNMFGMFLCNNSRERAERNIASRTFSVWNILQSPQFVNQLYSPQEQVLWPSCNIRDLELWRELYLGRSTGLDNLPVPETDIFPASSQDNNANVEVEFTNGEDLNGNGEEQNNHLEESDTGKQEESKQDEDLENQDQIDELLTTEWNKAFRTETPQYERTDGVSHDQAGASVESSTETLRPTNNTPDLPLSVGSDNDGAAVAAAPVPALALALTPAPALALVPALTPRQEADCSRPVPTLLDPVDGLTSPRDPVQQRLTMMVQEHKARELALERELHATRLALLQQVCHQCSNTGGQERPDDDGSVCSTEVSWEAVEEQEVLPTLWVPDHAVSHCMGCHNQFWLGRRKHHCRSCGKVFCADCSPNTLPLPEEQLYEPVRVCAECYKGPSKEPVPDMTTCKQAAGNTLLSPASAHTHA